MVNPHLIFKVVFAAGKHTVIKALTQVPAIGDKVRMNNRIYEVTDLLWDYASYDPASTGYQAVISVSLNQIGVTP